MGPGVSGGESGGESAASETRIPLASGRVRASGRGPSGAESRGGFWSLRKLSVRSLRVLRSRAEGRERGGARRGGVRIWG